MFYGFTSLCIYLFIVTGADIEYAKTNHMVNDVVLEFVCLKEQKLKSEYKLNHDSKKVR